MKANVDLHMFSTARCTDRAPCGPRKARPRPYMLQKRHDTVTWAEHRSLGRIFRVRGAFSPNLERLVLGGGGGGKPDYLQKLKVPEGYEKINNSAVSTPNFASKL